MWIIAGVASTLATLIIERYWFLNFDFSRHTALQVERWKKRSDRQSWHARHIRQALIADAAARTNQTLPMIKLSVALCPMLGLLGTVVGMMSVFDVIATMGTGNARAMAAGISQATIPTMAGMIVAIPGLYFLARLQQKVSRCIERFSDHLLIG